MAGVEVDTTGNVADLLRRAAATAGAEPALLRASGSRGWAEFDAAVDAGASALLGAGLADGERVLIALPTGPDLALALLAVARAGGVAVPVDPAADLAALAGRFDIAQAITRDSTDGVRTAAVSFGGDELAQWWRGGGDASPAAPSTRAGGEDLALIGRASSGTKAVMLSHRALLSAVAAVLAVPGEATGVDKVLITAPLFQVTAFGGVFLPAMARGMTSVFAGAPGAAAALEAVRDLGVTVLAAGPGLYHTIRKNPTAAESLATVRLMTSSSAPLDPQDFAALLQMTGRPVWEGYACSEASGVVCTSLLTEVARPGSVGLPLPGIEIRVVDTAAGTQAGAGVGITALATDEPVDAPPEVVTDSGDVFGDVLDTEDVGVIELRGPIAFSGYWPDGRGAPDDEGWFRTGDFGYADDAGELHVIDPVGETIKVSGFTVYPREVERVLDEHPYVSDVAVVGVPGTNGADVIAVIAVRPGTRPSETDLAGFAAERLPAFKRPVRYRLVKTLPRNEVGRLDRTAVRADYAAFAGIDPAVLEVRPDPDPSPGTATAPEATDAAEATEPPQATDAEVVAEEAADLGTLGTRLPGTGSRGLRHEQDTDDDLFGDEVS